MLTVTRLDPSLPVHVLDKGTGECIAWFDYGKEDHLLWLVSLDVGGECWLVPNHQIRLIKNYSLGRVKVDKKKI